MKMQHIAYLSLGTNRGDKFENLQNAIHLIDSKIGSILNIASVYETPSWGFEGADFYNTCLKIATHLLPISLMKEVLDIEKELGRERNDNSRYSDRSIDIDILLFEDTVLYTEEVSIPHPKMLERTFVLVPLVEIATNVLHPVENKTLYTCLEHCVDTSEIRMIKKKLIYPMSIAEKYNYIAIEGNIGVGKTSLAKRIADEFNAKTVLERFADNPFLSKFYTNHDRYAFPLEVSFLADRYQQLFDDLAQFGVAKKRIITDYYIFKSLIFAKITLQNDEYILYKKIFDLMYKETIKPDLYIYLYQNTEGLLQNIKKRGRKYEQNIDASYLQKIHDGYTNFIKTHQQNLNILSIDVSHLDFVSNNDDYRHILHLIKSH